MYSGLVSCGAIAEGPEDKQDKPNKVISSSYDNLVDEPRNWSGTFPNKHKQDCLRFLVDNALTQQHFVQLCLVRGANYRPASS